MVLRRVTAGTGYGPGRALLLPKSPQIAVIGRNGAAVAGALETRESAYHALDAPATIGDAGQTIQWPGDAHRWPKKAR